MLRLKHLLRLAKDVFAYSESNRAWWLIPVMVLFAVIAVALVTTQAAVPYAVYTLF